MRDTRRMFGVRRVLGAIGMYDVSSLFGVRRVFGAIGMVSASRVRGVPAVTAAMHRARRAIGASHRALRFVGHLGGIGHRRRDRCLVTRFLRHGLWLSGRAPMGGAAVPRHDGGQRGSLEQEPDRSQES